MATQSVILKKYATLIFHHTTTQSPQEAIYICAGVTRRVASSIDSSRGEATFLQIDTTNLSPTRQKKIISLAKTEFKAQSTDTKFSQAPEEAWCANFVSWIMYQAGAPLKIRILAAGVSRGRLPCVNTYEANGRFASR